MNKNTLVSIIVPVYNTSFLLRRCIDSLLTQTYKNIEIIVVNDGSTDNSLEVLQTYSSDKIKVFSKENGGLSDARNYGIRKVSGEFLAFVDSDDWVETNFIEKMITLAKNNDADMVICNIQKVNEQGKVFNKIEQISHLQGKIELEKDFSLFGEISCFACNKLFKKDLFNTIEFYKGIHFEDIATIPRLLLLCKNIAKTDDYLYNYFERRGSISQSFTQKGLDIFKAINIVKKSFEKSIYNVEVIQWKRFCIYQGFYSAGAYLARIKDKNIKLIFYKRLIEVLDENSILISEIKIYKRNNRNYLEELEIRKKVFYYTLLYYPKILFL